MANNIQLLKNNDKRDWDDVEWVDEFYRFLTGETPGNINEGKPMFKLSEKKAYTIIWYLQEHFPILPDTKPMISLRLCHRYTMQTGRGTILN